MIRRSIAALEVLLILPAALFMVALVARYLPGHDAQRIVLWYAGRQWTLWLLLIALPLMVLFTGFGALFGKPLRGDVAAKVIATTTTSAALILAIVGLHMAMN